MTTATANTLIEAEKSTNVRVHRGAPSWVRAGFSGASRLAPGTTSAVVAHLFRSTRRSKPRQGERDVLANAAAWRVAGIQLWAWGEGPTVLLVHGWNGRATQLGAMVEPLVARGYRVVAFDAIGHGDSVGTKSSLPEFANCIRQVADQLGGVHAVIAHSLGGAATTFALAYGLQAERAVFISPPADPREFLKIFSGALGVNEDVRARVKEGAVSPVHLTVLGVLLMAGGVLEMVEGTLVGVAAITAWAAGKGSLLTAAGLPSEGPYAYVPLLTAVITLTLAWTLGPLQIVAGYGVYNRRAWARWVGIVSAIVVLPALPLGTILGIYALVVLLNPRLAAVLRGDEES